MQRRLEPMPLNRRCHSAVQYPRGRMFRITVKKPLRNLPTGHQSFISGNCQAPKKSHFVLPLTQIRYVIRSVPPAMA